MNEFPSFNSLPFVLRLVIDPVRALDLMDGADKPDHGKILPAIVLFTVLVFKFIEITFAPIELVILFSAAYGYGAWRTFLKQRSVTHDTREVNTRIETITSKRDYEAGIEPTDD